MAVRFPGGGTSYLDYTGGAPDTLNCTVVLWVNLAVDSNDYVSCLPRFRNSGDSTTMWVGTVASGTNIAFASAGSGEVPSGKDLVVGRWMPVAFTSTGGAATIYAADSESGVVTTASGTVSGNTPAAKYCFGARGPTDSTENFNGRLAGVKLYNGTLSLAEIRAEWSQLYPVRTAGLYAAYPMDTNSAEGRLDVSGNGRMLTLGGSALATEEGPPIIRQRIAVRPYRLLANVGISRTLDGSGSASDGFTGAVDLSRPVAGNASAAGGFTGAVILDRPVSGGAGASDGFTGDIVRDRGLTSHGDASSGATGSLSGDRPVDGVSGAAAGFTAAVTLATALAGDAGTSSDAAGSLSLSRDIAGSSSSSSDMTGDLALARALLAISAAASGLSGELGGAGSMSGNVAASSGFTGNADLNRAILGVIAGAVGFTGDLTVTGDKALDGMVSSAAFASALISAARSLSADSGSASFARGTLTVSDGTEDPMVSVLLPTLIKQFQALRPTPAQASGRVLRPKVTRQ